MNLETVRELTKLYSDLATLDNNIKAMITKPSWKETPLQKVTFYMCIGGYSGPMDYEPKHTSAAISASIICDMKIERGLITTRIHSLGFETPDAPNP